VKEVSGSSGEDFLHVGTLARPNPTLRNRYMHGCCYNDAVGRGRSMDVDRTGDSNSGEKMVMGV
jgi:hypothetical protein